MPEIKHSRVTSTDSSDAVVLTAGAKELIEVIYAHIVFTSTATAGNRQLRFIVQDDSDVLVSDIHAGAVQAASLTRHYAFVRGVYRESSFVADEIQVPIPSGSILLPGWDLRITDSAAVAAAADDMVVNIVYKSTTLGKGTGPKETGGI